MHLLRSTKRELASLLLALIFFQAGCLVRKRDVAPKGVRQVRPVLSATKEELIARIHKVSDPIQSFTMKTDMSPSVGNLYGGQVTDYPTISGIIYYLRPNNIRVIGLDLVVHSTAFDMVSMGDEFRVWIPSKNEFIVGENTAPANSKNKLENLRPAAFLNALLINPPDEKDITIQEDDTNESKAVYILMIIRREGDKYTLLRNIYFDRYTLRISRQRTFDGAGNILSDTKYGNWVIHDTVPFPANIDIQRPRDGYEVVLAASEVKLNPGTVTPDKFVVPQPPGSQLKSLK
jgi:hypothetical protein